MAKYDGLNKIDNQAYPEKESKSDLPKELKPVDPVVEYKRLQYQKNYKTTNELYTQARENEKFVTGIQWDGINSKNLKRAVYNFVGQMVSIKNASILANELAILRSPDDSDLEDEKTLEAVHMFNLADKKNWKRLEMDYMNRGVVYDGSLMGIGCSYWWWDDDIVSGNSFTAVGDINGRRIDQVDLYVANAKLEEIQDQPWVKITVDMTVEQLRDYARNKGVPEDQIMTIVADEQETFYRAFEKADYEEDNTEDQLATLVINFCKKNGQVYKSETTQYVKIEEWKDIDMTLYPIAIFTYKPRKSFFYGEAEPTRYLENQRIANVQAAMRHLHALLMGIPKVLVNERMTGSFSNVIGSVNKVKAPPGTPLSNAMAYVQPTAMSLDVDKSINDSIQRTQELAGVNENILGAARPENAAALLTQIKQANVPIEDYKQRLYKYVRDVGAIWREFYISKYNVARKVIDKETGESFEFTGSEFREIFMNTSTDVGPSTQWSEITSFQGLLDLWDRGVVKNPSDVLERLPNDFVKDQNGLVRNVRSEDMLKEIVAVFASVIDPQMGAELEQMPLSEQVEMIIGMIGGAPDEQQAQATPM